MIDQQSLENRIIEISKELNLSHIGSNISCLPVYMEIYEKKRPEDIVIACNAHSHLAHLLVKEAYHPIVASFSNEKMKKANRWPQRMIKEHGIHCDRKAGCDASGGSLGHGLGIAIGYALTNRKRDVYIVVSDGSMMEGSCWEALRLIDAYRLSNIKIYTNFNGYTAVAKIDRDLLVKRMKAFVKDINVRYTDNGDSSLLEGLKGHYATL